MALTYSDKPWVKTYDTGIPASIDYPNVPLHQFLVDTTNKYPNKTALITSAKLPVVGRVSSGMTYRELNSASDALAKALVELGLKKGDRVAIVMPNSVAFAISFFATLKAGGVVAATNPTLRVAKKLIAKATLFGITIATRSPFFSPSSTRAFARASLA
ncbi:MAG: AMP-binding protein, partial [Chloroflexota bacterium]